MRDQGDTTRNQFILSVYVKSALLDSIYESIPKVFAGQPFFITYSTQFLNQTRSAQQPIAGVQPVVDAVPLSRIFANRANPGNQARHLKVPPRKSSLSSPGTRRGLAMLLPIRLDTDRVSVLIPVRQGMSPFHRLLSSANGFIQPEKSGEHSRHHRYRYQKRISIGLNCRHCSPFGHRDHAMKYPVRHSKCLSDRVLKRITLHKYSRSPHRRPSALTANSDLCQTIGRVSRYSPNSL